MTQSRDTGFLQIGIDLERCWSGGNFIKDYFITIYSEFCVHLVIVLAFYANFDVIYVKKVLMRLMGRGKFSKTFFFITDVTDKQVRVYGPQRPLILSM
jgi:hypothetical protein